VEVSVLRLLLLLSIVISWPPSIDEARAADIANGERLFRACSGCHSMEPGRHLTGPSLAGAFGRRAGTAEGFRRYSDALKSADLIWMEDTLDAWLTDPKGLIPGNLMTFPGIDDPEARRDLIAFIQAAQSGAPQGSGQGEGGMMGGPALDDLENLPPENQVDAITYCGDTYRVTTRAGQTIPFWEFNLRFKTDSSDRGPSKGSPALLRASMMGDRAFVIFADPAEISSFIQPQC
jgi:cytochrome c